MIGGKIHEPHTPAAADRVHFVLQRLRIALLGFPHFCVKTACRRARRCSSDRNICMGSLGPLVSKDVRDGVDALVWGHLDGLSYDQVRARDPWAVAAYEQWNAKICESIRETAALARREQTRATRAPSPT
jgi:hypothetical protein